MTPISTTATARDRHRTEAAGWAWGLAGVLAFSLTLPLTRVAVRELDPWLIGLGRALVAALPAAAYLWFARAPRPSAAQWRTLAVVGLGVILGFPVATSIGLQTVPAAHGAVVVGLLPLASALFATWLGGERPSARFWLWAVAGSLVVLVFAWRHGDGALARGDLWLLLAVALGGLGYAEGGRLARSLGGPAVICWALVLAAPVLALPVAWLAGRQAWPVSGATWGAFAYLALVSQWLGFFAWYRGLALGGVARVGQAQLLQVFLTIAAAAAVFGEAVAPSTWVYAALVAVAVALGRRAGVASPSAALAPGAAPSPHDEPRNPRP
ncbi:MAG TPA: DMT family transporter [Burkholderiaceae bacterium]|nr:DMT family transporter [Burkholderiaceae bacterium]